MPNVRLKNLGENSIDVSWGRLLSDPQDPTRAAQHQPFFTKILLSPGHEHDFLSSTEIITVSGGPGDSLVKVTNLESHDLVLQDNYDRWDVTLYPGGFITIEAEFSIDVYDNIDTEDAFDFDEFG